MAVTTRSDYAAERSASAPASAFAERELERMRRKIARYDELAEIHERTALIRGFGGPERVRRLLSSLVAPSSRVLEVGCGLGDVLASLDASIKVGIDISPRMIERARSRHPGVELLVADAQRDELPAGPFDAIILSDVISHLDDIQLALERLGERLAPGGRLIITHPRLLVDPILRLAEEIGAKEAWPEQSWLSMSDIENILRLSDFEVMRRGADALVEYVIARHVPAARPAVMPRVSIICPCRNEEGNIREAVARTPMMGPATELIFVDGSSVDGTVERIEAILREREAGSDGDGDGDRRSGERVELRLIHQGEGDGKGDAVRKGFAAARYEILMILDSDLTVPPEDLPKFYRALLTGRVDLINGVRLVYPMEGEAMRFLNLIGNKFFSTALSWILEQPMKDSLCGTKALRREAYDRIAEGRSFFGDFDPFGDFDLLFGAARLKMKIADLPVRYRARTYGDTKISRFSHGWQLLKMTAFGLKKLRLGL